MPETLTTNTWRTFALYGNETEEAIVCVNTRRPESYPSPSGGAAMRVIGTASARSHEEATLLLEPLRSQRRQASAQSCRGTYGPAQGRSTGLLGTPSPHQIALLDWALRARRALAERARAARDDGCSDAGAESLLVEFEMFGVPTEHHFFKRIGIDDEQERPSVLAAQAQG